jgi:uncharacterized membrane protein
MPFARPFVGAPVPANYGPSAGEREGRCPMVIQLVAVLVLGLMCGSELNVGALTHPALNKQPNEIHIPVRAALARSLGRLMPAWMPLSAVLNLVVILPFEHLSEPAWHLAVAAFCLQLLASVFSLIFPVPINNRIMRWTPETLPADWKQQEHRWDVYHLSRTLVLIAAFAILTLSLASR